MVREQLTAFALTIGAGLLAGLWFDFYRAVRRVLRLKKIGTFLGDLLFSLFLTVFIFGLLLAINYGEVRFYVIMGLALGALIYWRLFSRFGYGTIMFSFRFLQKTFHLVGKSISVSWRAFTFPFRVVSLALSKPLEFLCRSGKTIQSPFRKASALVVGSLKRFLRRV